MFVSESREGAVDIDALSFHLRTKLPGYKVPSEIVILKTFPVNEQGKVDRRQLEALAVKA
jgi:acyl-CoA synthetase (AMP-forming)/AMP-acid ligase II